MKEIKIGRVYKHYKGNRYLITNIGKHTETGQEFVVYKALYGDNLTWIRPVELFTDQTDYEGKNLDRFILDK